MYEEDIVNYGGGVLNPMWARKKQHATPLARMSDAGRDAILAAVKQELRSMLDQEDFGVRQLRTIASLAEMSRIMLADLSVDIKEAAKAAKESGALAAETDGVGAFTGALSPNSFPENFGGSAMREIVSGIGKLNQRKSHEDSLTEMVAAAAEAKREGLTDVADDIIAQIRDRMDAKKPIMSDPKEQPHAVVPA